MESGTAGVSAPELGELGARYEVRPKISLSSQAILLLGFGPLSWASPLRTLLLGVLEQACYMVQPCMFGFIIYLETNPHGHSSSDFAGKRRCFNCRRSWEVGVTPSENSPPPMYGSSRGNGAVARPLEHPGKNPPEDSMPVTFIWLNKNPVFVSVPIRPTPPQHRGFGGPGVRPQVQCPPAPSTGAGPRFRSIGWLPFWEPWQ